MKTATKEWWRLDEHQIGQAENEYTHVTEVAARHIPHSNDWEYVFVRWRLGSPTVIHRLLGGKLHEA